MKLHNLFSVMTAGVLLISAATLSAGPCCPGAGREQGQKQGKGIGNGGERQYRMFADLDLDDKQKEKIKSLHNEMTDIRKKHFEGVKDVRKKIKDELLKKSPSKKTLYGYAGELGKLHTQMSKNHADHLLKVKKVLSPEQFEKLVARQDSKHGRKGFMGCRNNKRCCDEKKGDCPRKMGKCPHKKSNCPHMQKTPPAEAAPPAGK